MKILLLEFPVRCLRCRQRQSVPFLMYALAASSETRNQKKGKDMSWNEWTAGTATPEEPAKKVIH